MESDDCKTFEDHEFAVRDHESICTKCGEVQDDLIDNHQLQVISNQEEQNDAYRNKNKEANERLNGRIRNETNNAQTRKRISREKMLDESKRMVKQIIKHPDAVSETMELVKITLNSYQGRLMQSKRQGLVAACIYYLSSKHQLGITLADICKLWGIRMKVMSASLKQVKQLCPSYEYERPNIRDLVNKFIDQLESKQYEMTTLINTNNQSSNHIIKQPLLHQKDKIVLTNRVMLLIDLYEAMHPFNQPTPQSLITAVVYHAWRSLDTFRMIAVNLSSNMRQLSSALTGNRDQGTPDNEPTSAINSNESNGTQVKHKISFEKFCQICDIKYSKNGYKVVGKVQTSLLVLGKCFGDINKLNLPWFLKDIIDNSAHLVQEHLKSNPAAD